MTARRVQARVSLTAIQRNCVRLRSELRSAELCAVVKADGYGHGAIESARAALAGGASWLAVASAREAAELRGAGLEGRVLIMGPLGPGELEEAVVVDADVVAWHEAFVAEMAETVAEVRGKGRVHVKLDSGMGRLGTRDPEEASRVVAAVQRASELELAGVMTHFATADDLHDDGFFDQQLELFAGWARAVKAEHPGTIVHAANSAAMLRDEASHFDMVRCGIAIYGMDPFGRDPFARQLEPALELRSYVAEVKRCAAGDSAGYGRRFVAERDTHLGVIPIGYGDGWRRGLSDNADVLIAGHRYPVVGTVSMDTLTVDLGGDRGAEALYAQEAVLVGAQGAERITAEQVAERLHTINYEITCGLTSRVPRLHFSNGELP
jgi:alanine racemase